MKKLNRMIAVICLVGSTTAAMAVDTMPVTNATGCLVDVHGTFQGIVPPVTVSGFVGTGDDLKYSGVSVAPGASADFPMGTFSGSPALFLGASPGDAAPHITANVPAPGNRSPQYAVQEFSPAGACTKAYPCVISVNASDPDYQDCVALARHAQSKAA